MTQDVFEKKMDSIVAAKYIVVRKNLQSDYKFRWNILLKAKVDSILGIAVPARVDSVSIPSDFTNQISTNNENETSDTSDQ